MDIFVSDLINLLLCFCIIALYNGTHRTATLHSVRTFSGWVLREIALKEWNFHIWFVGVVRRCLGSGRVSSQTKVTLATLFLRFRPQTTRRPVDSAESANGYGQRRFHGVIEGRMRQSSFFDFPGDSVIQVHVGRVGNAVGQAVEGKLREFADFYTERFKVVTARTKVLGINALELKRENPKSTFTTSTARITTPNSRFPN